MNESESKNEKPKEQRHFSQEQYDMLKRCSDKKDVTEWNEWRQKNPNEDILLEGADLRSSNLQKAYLVHANLQGARLMKADLMRANLAIAILMEAEICETNLQGANLDMVNMENAKLQRANLQGAFIPLANLEGTDLIGVNLQDAHLVRANLQNAVLRQANLIGANFEIAVVNGGTLIWECKVNRYSKNKLFTNFDGVGLDSVGIDPGTKQLLEYNIRRKNWEEWYEENPRLKYIVKPFWLMSDYGLSTGRIIFTFFGLVIIFANIYYHWGRLAPPGIIKHLFFDRNGIEVQWWLVPLRTLYFSIVTMTTLGFGDMYANAQSIWGHILLSIQVILGYVLLGALITRFAVLFTAGGPAGKFADDKKPQRTQRPTEIKNN